MTEMEPRRDGPDALDRLLRNSMAGPVPSLRPGFDQRVLRAVRRQAEPLDRYRRNLLAGYAVLSTVVSVVVMATQGLPWAAAAVSALAPLVLLAVARPARRREHNKAA